MRNHVGDTHHRQHGPKASKTPLIVEHTLNHVFIPSVWCKVYTPELRITATECTLNHIYIYTYSHTGVDRICSLKEAEYLTYIPHITSTLGWLDMHVQVSSFMKDRWELSALRAPSQSWHSTSSGMACVARGGPGFS